MFGSLHWFVMCFLGGMSVRAFTSGAYGFGLLILGGMLAESVLYHVQVDRTKP